MGCIVVLESGERCPNRPVTPRVSLCMEHYADFKKSQNLVAEASGLLCKNGVELLQKMSHEGVDRHLRSLRDLCDTYNALWEEAIRLRGRNPDGKA